MNLPQRLPMILGTLALTILGSVGCNSDKPATPVVDAAALPTITEGPTTTAFAPEVVAEQAVLPALDPAIANTDQDAQKVDSEVRRAADDAKDAVGNLKGEAEKATQTAKHHAKKAVEDARIKAEKKAKELEEKALKSAESGLDQIIGDPK